SRNPFFWGTGLVSLARVILLGDVAAILAFGSVAFLGIIGSLVLDAKKACQHEEAWAPFTPAPPNGPFLPIIPGRHPLAVGEIGPWRIALGLGVSLATLAFDDLLPSASLFESVRIAFR